MSFSIIIIYSSLIQSWVCAHIREPPEAIYGFSFYTELSLSKAYLIVHAYILSLWSCATLCGPMDCSLPGSSVLGILQARILEWLPFPLPNSGMEPESLMSPALAGRFFTTNTIWEAPGCPPNSGWRNPESGHTEGRAWGLGVAQKPGKEPSDKGRVGNNGGRAVIILPWMS